MLSLDFWRSAKRGREDRFGMEGNSILFGGGGVRLPLASKAEYPHYLIFGGETGCAKLFGMSDGISRSRYLEVLFPPGRLAAFVDAKPMLVNWRALVELVYINGILLFYIFHFYSF